jgi:hypothetical protein
MDHACEPSWTRSMRPWTYSTRFSVENNSIIIENSRHQEFYKNIPELFQNYVVVPKNLHIGPYLTFYNYN